VKRIRIAAGFLAAILSFSTVTAEPQSGKWLAVLLLAGPAVFFVRGINKPGLVALALYSWAALSLFWSADWRSGAMGLLYAGCLFAVACAVAVLDRAELKRTLPWCALVSLAVILALWLAMPVDDYGGFGNRNYASEAAVMLLPFALLLWKKSKWLTGFAALFCLEILFNNHGAMKWIALAVAAGALAYRFRAYTGWALPAFGFASTIVYAVVDLTPYRWTSLLARAEFAINGLYAWGSTPVWGHGFGSTNAVYPDYAERHAGLIGDTTIIHHAGRYVGSLHNEYIQLGLELGLVGFGLALWLAFVLVRHWLAKEKDGLDYASAWALFAILLVSWFAFPLQNPATAFLAAVSIGIVARGHDSIVSVPKLATKGAAIAIVVLSMPTALALYRADRTYRYALEAVKIGDFAGAVENNAFAVNQNPYAREPRHQMAILATGAYRRGFHIQPDAMDQAYSVSRSAAGNDPGVALARLEYLLNSGRAKDRKTEVKEIAERLGKGHRLLPETKLALEAAETVK
jgi:hypothetical protein